RAVPYTSSSRGSPSASASRPTPIFTIGAPRRSPERLLDRLALGGGPEVVRDLVHERGHHLLARIGLRHRAADALLGHVDAADLPANPARACGATRAGFAGRSAASTCP